MVPSLCGSRSVASPAYSSSAPTPSRRSLDTPSRDSTASALAARRISPPMAMRRVQFVDAETDKRPRSQSASVLLATPVELAPRRNLKWQPPVRELAEEGGGSAAQIRKRVDSRWSVYTENVMRELTEDENIVLWLDDLAVTPSTSNEALPLPIPPLASLPEIIEDSPVMPALSPSSSSDSSPVSFNYLSTPPTRHLDPSDSSFLTSTPSRPSPSRVSTSRLFHPTRWTRRNQSSSSEDQVEHEVCGLGINLLESPSRDELEAEEAEWELIPSDSPSYIQGQRHAPPITSNSKLSMFQPHPQVRARRLYRTRKGAVPIVSDAMRTEEDKGKRREVER